MNVYYVKPYKKIKNYLVFERDRASWIYSHFPRNEMEQQYSLDMYCCDVFAEKDMSAVRHGVTLHLCIRWKM